MNRNGGSRANSRWNGRVGFAVPLFLTYPGPPFTKTLCDAISARDFVPQKVRELVAELERAGFVNRGGKGSHRNFVHPRVSKPITISGALGDDAKHYQVRAVKRAVEESKS